MLGIDRFGIDVNLERKGYGEDYTIFNFFIGKEWIDKNGSTYLYDIFGNDKTHKCYIKSNSLTKKNGFTTYKLSKFTLTRNKKTFTKTK